MRPKYRKILISILQMVCMAFGAFWLWVFIDIEAAGYSATDYLPHIIISWIVYRVLGWYSDRIPQQQGREVDRRLYPDV